MNDPESPLRHNPFLALEKLLKDKVVRRPEPAHKPIKTVEPSATMVSEESVFQEAMEGVKPMAGDKEYAEKKSFVRPPVRGAGEADLEVKRQLDNLIKYGEGFIISQTPEYMEGLGLDIPQEFAARLHRGDFAIQGHLDLHGLSIPQAQEAFEQFLHKSLLSAKRGLLIIHGRGISSSGEPVLKNKVREWLTRSRWRKWVIAFTSAQSYDGGTGATYVLLRQRPRLKGSRKS
jgi:DNA-nicking Smr family endonuclease